MYSTNVGTVICCDNKIGTINVSNITTSEDKQLNQKNSFKIDKNNCLNQCDLNTKKLFNNIRVCAPNHNNFNTVNGVLPYVDNNLSKMSTIRNNSKNNQLRIEDASNPYNSLRNSSKDDKDEKELQRASKVSETFKFCILLIVTKI